MPSKGIIYARKEDGTDDKTIIVSYAGKDKNISFIPNSVTKIYDFAFLNYSIKSVKFSKFIKSIGKEAFYNNELTSVTIPKSVTLIDDWAFSKNDILHVTIPNPNTTIGKGAFDNNCKVIRL